MKGQEHVGKAELMRVSEESNLATKSIFGASVYDVRSVASALLRTCIAVVVRMGLSMTLASAWDVQSLTLTKKVSSGPISTANWLRHLKPSGTGRKQVIELDFEEVGFEACGLWCDPIFGAPSQPLLLIHFAQHVVASRCLACRLAFPTRRH
jgi:hypothetical protein